GWVERRPDPDDRRINRMHLTDRGRRVHAAIWPIALSTVDDALARLSNDERDVLVELLGRVKGELVELAGADNGQSISAEEILGASDDDMSEARA
ncbi:MAG TPA: hypothetical protein PK264_22460, partial [Hyphomicrobiaceae bacterium]|nr:hypothetical protein [Hyphomicrobiaceae bacterium]